MTIETRWHIIGRGLVGWHAAGLTDLGQGKDRPGATTTSSGGDLLPYRYGATPCPGYAAEAVDGAPVYDASEADARAFSQFVIKGPMVSAALEPDGWTKFGHSENRPRALDTVGTARYVRLLRASVPGVKFGRVEAGAVVWEA